MLTGRHCEGTDGPRGELFVNCVGRYDAVQQQRPRA